MRNKIILDLGKLAPAEVLWVSRKAAGLTQVEAARRAGLSENRYLDAEKGRIAAPTPSKIGARRVSRPSLALLLALARRRSGLGLDAVARALRTSKVTVLAKERRADAGLRTFWEGMRFTFPR